MYSLLMCLTEQEEAQILINDDVMSYIDWKSQFSLILKHIDIIQADKIPRIRKYIGRFAYWILEKKSDVWAFVILNLIIGNWSTQNLYENPNYQCYNSLKMNLPLNFMSTMLEKLTCVPDTKRPTPILLELNLSRALIFGKQMSMHEDAHEELH